MLVIGGAGLIGAHVAAEFASRALVTYHGAPVEGATQLDILDADRTRALIRRVAPGTVVLAAAEPWVERCEREPAATRRLNVEAARAVAEGASAARSLLVVFSSEYVFDGTKGRYVEDDPARPINEYGRQKAELEAIARTVPRHLVCRTSGVFGWEPERKNFVCRLLERLRAGREFVVPADQLITPTYAVDLARALATLVARGTTGTIHVVGPRIVRRTAFAATVCRVFGLPRELIVPRATDEMGLAAPRPRDTGLADDRLRGVLGASLADPASALADMRAREVAAPRG
ncbi:MAG: NAD(P)-dependent oxidoreductase [Elusimicrobia bacterium]|nr:NAD(P)-dependent oxidoreductase [Elusimicrobiota bacterium]